MPPPTGLRSTDSPLPTAFRRGPDYVGPYGPSLTRIRHRIYEQEYLAKLRWHAGSSDPKSVGRAIDSLPAILPREGWRERKKTVKGDTWPSLLPALPVLPAGRMTRHDVFVLDFRSELLKGTQPNGTDWAHRQGL